MSEHRKALWPTEEGKPVQVDQGALIRKVLARYPGEFTLFRELLQNSDDAQSDSAEIHFETATSRRPTTPPNPKLSDIVQWTFKNDGNQFTQEDWTRLAKIAKGNANPAKVGAFGVGFYSLFSVTDNPVVLSGGHGMEFYWDDIGQLLFCQGAIPSEGTTAPWTTFRIPLREPSPMPRVVDFMRFLATSITFMVHLKDVKVVLDGHCIGHIHKSPGVTEAVDPPIELQHSSPSKLMVVDKLQRYRFTIQAKLSTEILESSLTVIQASSRKRDVPSASQLPLQSDSCVQSSTGDPPRFYTTELGLTVFTAEVHVEVNERLFKELLRCTSKKPPSQFTYSLVYTGKDEYDRSFVDQKNQPLVSVFQGLRADLNGASHPRIFVGHSTSQTTGIGGHMASLFIPTVERESIDLVDMNVAVWNKELLYVGGFLARTVYELELSAIQTSWEEATGSNKHRFQDRLRDRFVHVLRFFTFNESTPSPKVAQLLQRSFYDCSTSPLRLLSSVGVRYARDIRSFDSLCSKFLKDVPMLSPDITNIARSILDALPDEHKIRAVTLMDVLQDLRGHTLDQGELVAYLQWQLPRGSTVDRVKLLEVATFWGGDRSRIELSTIQSFIDSNGPGAHIPSDGPMPLSLIPLEITKSFNPVQLMNLGWREFTITDWLRYISQQEIREANPQHDFVRSVDWAEHVLRTISFVWSSSDEIRGLAKSVFAHKKCIPIMRKLYSPEETYLPSQDIPAFDDLGLLVVRFPSGQGISGEMERLLVSLGVQRHIAPRLLLKRMIETGKWGTSNLIDYLVQVADTLSLEEITELKSYDAFAGVGGQNDTSKMRFRADELYPPIPTFQQLKLRVIEWKRRSGWRDTSPEAELLYRLGLCRYPSLEKIIELCSQDDAVGESAFSYLCTNLRSVYASYNPDKFQHIAFIPAANTSGPRLEKLGDVFLDYQWKTLELSVIRHKYPESILEELGVQRHPPSSLLLHTLQTKPPPNEEVARQWFEILSNHVPRFAQNELEILSKWPIVPKTISGEERKWLNPVQCYLGKSTKHDLYSELFHFVNFGTGAIQFLRACHAKNEPSEEDVAECLADNHDEFFRLAGRERFLQELRDLAARHTRIPNDTISKMRLKPVLLGAQREKTTNPDGWKNNYSLFEPREIVIVNDIHAYQLFGDSIVAAPQNMAPELEEFYRLLGCKRLTTVVRSECNPSNEKEDTTMCSERKALIKQRLFLFLRHYQYQPGTMALRFSGAITVRVCEHLSVTQTLTIGKKKTVKKRSVWATAEDEQGTIEVWISLGAKEDMYELAVSLCRVLFDAVNLNDALLLTSILSEDLDVLKGRGYEVGRDLQSSQDFNDSCLSEEMKGCSSITPETPSQPCIDPTTQLPVNATDVDSLPQYAGPTTSPSPVPEGSEPTPCSSIPSSEIPQASAFAKVTNNIRDGLHAVARRIMSNIDPSSTTTAAVLPPPPWSPRQVMPRSYIQSTVKESIQACNVGPFHHCSDADMIKFLNDGYCTVSEPIENLKFLGSTGNVEVYAGQGISNVDTFMECMQDQLAHFARIITRVSKVYGLPTASLHIFYDTTAGCIAFNRKGVLYLNLRYFEAWHYQDVKTGNSRRALSSWFLTLGHEIAHNIVARHDSEHEFWFAAVCEAHIDAFSQLLGPPPSTISG